MQAYIQKYFVKVISYAIHPVKEFFFPFPKAFIGTRCQSILNVCTSPNRILAFADIAIIVVVLERNYRCLCRHHYWHGVLGQVLRDIFARSSGFKSTLPRFYRGCNGVSQEEKLLWRVWIPFFVVFIP